MVGAVSSASYAYLTPAQRREQEQAISVPAQTDLEELLEELEEKQKTVENSDSSSNSPAFSSENFNVLLQAQEGETNAEGLTEEEQEQVEELQQTDQEVRSHEQAHKSAAGPYAGAISYETTTGPDGREYAIGGSVQIDTSPIPGNPQATIRKAEIVERAALAPADPSPEDFAVARAAQNLRLEAQRELSEQRELERQERGEESEEESGSAANSPLDLSEVETILSSVNQTV